MHIFTQKSLVSNALENYLEQMVFTEGLKVRTGHLTRVLTGFLNSGLITVITVNVQEWFKIKNGL